MPTFTAPDGKVFTERKEYKKYLLTNFLSFKDVVNEAEPCIRRPGDVNGMDFTISNCTNSTLIIMDHTEQIQIDDVSHCSIFIGACSSSIFIRNCTECTFFVCCRQLRLREVKSCRLHVYSH